MSDPRRTTPGDPLAGYTSPPPPGAGGLTGESTWGEAGHWELSGWWRRAGAQIVDGIIIAVVALIVLAVVGAIAGSTSIADDTVGVVAAIFGVLIWGLCAVVAALVYAPWMMARTNGQTLGRMVTGIRVVRANGKPIDFGWAMLREVAVKWLLFNAVGGSVTFGLAPLVDVLWPLWDEEKRALHDLIVDSRTIRV
jgi:uncharacterized RDD family membrane protein YckC